MNDVETIETAHQLADRDIRTLLDSHDEGRCITIYIDTLPDPNGKDKNRIRYKDQVKQAAAALDAQDTDKFERAALVDQLDHIGTTDDFWIHQQYGLAVFLSPQRLLVRKLMARPGNRVIVGATFHLRPALQISHDAHLHHILCVSADQVRLYSGGHLSFRRMTVCTSDSAPIMPRSPGCPVFEQKDPKIDANSSTYLLASNGNICSITPGTVKGFK